MSGEPRKIDRLRELTGIGAGPAAAALGQLLRRPVRPHPPRVRHGAVTLSARAMAICFDVHGGPGGVFAVLFPEKEMDTLLDAMLGAPEPERMDQVESALQEVGNILASHALSAVADELGAIVVPSVPRLTEGAPPDEGPRVEVDLVDEEGALHGTLLWLPGASPLLR